MGVFSDLKGTTNSTFTVQGQTVYHSGNLISKVGKVEYYTGTDGSNVGWHDDLGGKRVFLTLDAFRTIGNASSGAAIAASWCQVLFEHLWVQYSNTLCPVVDSSGATVTRGASATADWNANRRIRLPDFRGRVLLPSGSGSGLTARAKSASGGAETHITTLAESPTNLLVNVYGTPSIATNGFAGYSYSINSGGGAHNNMQPWWAEHLLITAGAL